MRMKKSAIFFLAVAAFVPGLRAEVLGVHRAASGTGWLEKTEQGDLVLHLEGTYYDMGVEQAKLLGPDTRMALRSAKNALRMEFFFLPPSLGLSLIYKYVYLKSAPFMPSTFVDELRGHYDSIEWEKGPTLGATSHQLAFDPKTGDFLIAVSRGNPWKQGRRAVSAFSQPYHHYNFFELLNREPGPEANNAVE